MPWNWLKHAFSIDTNDAEQLPEAERRVVDRLCQEVARRGLVDPALMFLEMSRPLNYLGAQALHFFQPMIGTLVDSDAPKHFASFLERRGAIDALCRTLEACRKGGQRDADAPPTHIDVKADGSRPSPPPEP
ncbi:MAG: hypothetical protein IT428_09875 [Planctomycetaceae bacterium]|nr:hypothetical protein [Planctomycetaceae bacterium]